MIFIIDKNLPFEAKDKLSSFGEIIEFSSDGITYKQISNHPDVFFCKTDHKLICAPNTPQEYFELFKTKNIEFILGDTPVGEKYPASAPYNAVVTEKFFIHNQKVTDPKLAELIKNKEPINVKQGYTRCSLLSLRNNSFITSDKGIYKKLSILGVDVLYVNPNGITLTGAEYGFFGGTSGIYGDILFIAGKLDLFDEGRKVQNFAVSNGVEIVELCNTTLIDCGSILVL